MVSTTLATVWVERTWKRYARIGFAKAMTQRMGRHMNIPPKVTSLMVCPKYVVSNVVGCSQGNTPVVVGVCRK